MITETFGRALSCCQPRSLQPNVKDLMSVELYLPGNERRRKAGRLLPL